MQDGTYPPRSFATLGPSRLQPPFTGTYWINNNLFAFILQHRAGVRFYTSFYNFAKSCVFIKQSLLPLIICSMPSFSRSYWVNLPSSFRIVTLFALVFSTYPQVWVLVRLNVVFSCPLFFIKLNRLIVLKRIYLYKISENYHLRH